LADTYLFTPMPRFAAEPGNRRPAHRLIGFSWVGARGGSSAKTILFDRGRNSTAWPAASARTARSYRFRTRSPRRATRSSARPPLVPYRNISAAVKTIVVWNPTVYLSDKEMKRTEAFRAGWRPDRPRCRRHHEPGGSSNNTLKRISDFGYRLALPSSVQYRRRLRCATTLTGPDSRRTRFTSGVTSVQILCASGMFTGSNAYTLLTSAQQSSRRYPRST
jgi:hypothetical protein